MRVIGQKVIVKKLNIQLTLISIKNLCWLILTKQLALTPVSPVPSNAHYFGFTVFTFIDTYPDNNSQEIRGWPYHIITIENRI